MRLARTQPAHFGRVGRLAASVRQRFVIGFARVERLMASFHGKTATSRVRGAQNGVGGDRPDRVSPVRHGFGKGRRAGVEPSRYPSQNRRVETRAVVCRRGPKRERAARYLATAGSSNVGRTLFCAARSRTPVNSKIARVPASPKRGLARRKMRV